MDLPKVSAEPYVPDAGLSHRLGEGSQTEPREQQPHAWDAPWPGDAWLVMSLSALSVPKPEPARSWLWVDWYLEDCT